MSKEHMSNLVVQALIDNELIKNGYLKTKQNDQMREVDKRLIKDLSKPYYKHV